MYGQFHQPDRDWVAAMLPENGGAVAVNIQINREDKMKTIKLLSVFAFAFVLLGGLAFAEDQTCCQKAKAAGKECEHKCCVEAHKKGESCKKCNPNGEDIKKDDKAAKP